MNMRLSGSVGTPYSYAESVCSDFIKVTEGTYTFSRNELGSGAGTGYVWAYDAQRNPVRYIDYINGNLLDNQFVIQEGEAYLRFNLFGMTEFVLLDNVHIQLNIGSTALPYIPHEHNDVFYKSADDFLNVPVAEDRLVYINGKWKHEHNIERKVLTEDDVTRYLAYSPNYIAEIPLANLEGIIVQSSTLLGAVAVSGFREIVGGSGASLWVDYTVGTNDTYLRFGATTLFTDLASAKTALAGTVIYYQLSEPYYTDVEVSGIPTAYANGSVFNDPVVPDAGVYDSGITILNSDYPIESFERISVYANGVFTDLDISTAVITGDGLSFTHPDLSKDDIVTFDYRYAQASPMGEMTAEYYNSAVILKDTVTGALYRKVDTVASGVLTTTLEAV